MTRRNPLMDRRALFASGAAAALLAASGVMASGVPRSGGRLRMALSGADRNDDWTGGDGLFMQVARQGVVFDTLIEVAADGTVRGELAINWQSFEGGRRWSFDLRKSVPFHDGAELTSRDVMATLEPLFGQSALFKPMGKYRIEITLNTARPDLPLLFSQPEFVIRTAHAPDAGIGTGLYRVKHFAAGQQLLTQRVGKHYKDGSAGWFDEIELVSIPCEKVRVQALGEYLVDVADVVDTTEVAALANVAISPQGRCGMHAVSRDIAQPHQIGQLRPLDNLRAAERWWFG